MKRFDFSTRKNCARLIFIFGILTGLLFSNGEGVQLLPFPSAEINNTKNARRIIENNRKSYSFSVLNLGNQPPLTKPKFQKQSSSFSLTAHLIFNLPNASANICVRSLAYGEKTNLSPISYPLISQADRAPPQI